MQQHRRSTPVWSWRRPGYACHRRAWKTAFLNGNVPSYKWTAGAGIVLSLLWPSRITEQCRCLLLLPLAITRLLRAVRACGANANVAAMLSPVCGSPLLLPLHPWLSVKHRRGLAHNRFPPVYDTRTWLGGVLLVPLEEVRLVEDRGSKNITQNYESRCTKFRAVASSSRSTGSSTRVCRHRRSIAEQPASR